MYQLTKLQPYIGAKKTLVISTEEIEQFYTLESRIFVHIIGGTSLLRYDQDQKEILKYYIEQKDCSKIIMVGSKDSDWISTVQQDESLYSLAASLKFNLSALLRDKHNQILHPKIRTQIMTEFLIIKQCKFLMEYFFIKEKVQQNKLNVQGVVPLPNGEQLKSIYYNGIVYNDLLTLN
jgi:hypothetical protein